MISYDLYARLRDERGLTDGKVSKMAGFGRSTFSDWKAGRSKPKNDKLEKIRVVLDIPVDEWLRLQGINDNIPNSYPVDLICSMLGVTAEEIELAREIGKLDEEGRKMIALMLAFYKNKDEL